MTNGKITTVKDLERLLYLSKSDWKKYKPKQFRADVGQLLYFYDDKIQYWDDIRSPHIEILLPTTAKEILNKIER